MGGGRLWTYSDKYSLEIPATLTELPQHPPPFHPFCKLFVEKVYSWSQTSMMKYDDGT